MSEPVSPLLTIAGLLDRLRRRQRLLNTLRGAAHGLWWGTVLAVVVATCAAAARADWSDAGLWLATTLVPAAVLGGAAFGLLRRVDSLRVARALDRAAGSEDRFASAVQLAGHHRRHRVRLIADDALARVCETRAGAALPLRAPRSLKWVPLTVLALIIVFVVAPNPSLDANVRPVPEVSPEQWQALHDTFREALQQLPPPATEEEEQIARRLERIASMLAEKPSKKDALAELSVLRAELERRRRAFASQDLSLNDAARAVRSSRELQGFAAMLRRGEFRKAAGELRSLAERLAGNTLQMTASDFEAAALDLDQLALELAPRSQLAQSCQQCSSAAASMNRLSLAEALRRFADRLVENADQLREYQSCCRASSLLDDLTRRLNQCRSCSACGGVGCPLCQGTGRAGGFVRRSDRQGGLRAGWGTAADWGGGAVEPAPEHRLPALAETRETAGIETTSPAVSTDERAESGIDFKEAYAELVRKAEADLDLEMVPVAYREYLRRYFRAIRPVDESGSEAPDG